MRRVRKLGRIESPSFFHPQSPNRGCWTPSVLEGQQTTGVQAIAALPKCVCVNDTPHSTCAVDLSSVMSHRSSRGLFESRHWERGEDVEDEEGGRAGGGGEGGEGREGGGRKTLD